MQRVLENPAWAERWRKIEGKKGAIMDSGATLHVKNDLSQLQDYAESQKQKKMKKKILRRYT